MAKYNIPSGIPNNDPEAPRKRVEDEFADLNTKIQSLRLFLNTDKHKALTEEMQDLLEKQLSVMEEYSEILFLRLKAWN